MVSILHFAMMVNKIDRPNTTPTVRGIICTFVTPFIFFAVMVNKIDRPNTTPFVAFVHLPFILFCRDL